MARAPRSSRSTACSPLLLERPWTRLHLPPVRTRSVMRRSNRRVAGTERPRDSWGQTSGTADGRVSLIVAPPSLSVWRFRQAIGWRRTRRLATTRADADTCGRRCDTQARTVRCRARRYGSPVVAAETSQRGRILMRNHPWCGGVPCSGRSPSRHRGSALAPCVAIAAVSLALLTLVVPALIETPTAWDPDHGGRAEWSVAVALMSRAGTTAVGARRRPRGPAAH